MTEIELEQVREVMNEMIEEKRVANSAYRYPVRGAFEILMDRLEEVASE